MSTITILSPVPETVVPGAGDRSSARAAFPTRRVALFANGKPNALLLLDGVAEVLQRTQGIEVAYRASKTAASFAADREMLDRIAAEADVAVVASAD